MFSPRMKTMTLAATLVLPLLFLPARVDGAISKTDLGKAPEARQLLFSEDNLTVAWIGHSGSRYAMYVDGKVGPKFDEIVSSVHFTGNGHYSYTGRRGNQHIRMVDGKEREMASTGTVLHTASKGKRTVGVIQVQGTPTSMGGEEIYVDGKLYGTFTQNHVAKVWISPSGRHAVFVTGQRTQKGEQVGPSQFTMALHILTRGKEPQVYKHVLRTFIARCNESESDLYVVAKIRRTGKPQGKDRASLMAAAKKNTGKQSDWQLIHNDKVIDKFSYVQISTPMLNVAADGSVAYTKNAVTNANGADFKSITVVMDGRESKLTNVRQSLRFNHDSTNWAVEQPTKSNDIRMVVNGKTSFEYAKVTDFTFAPKGDRYAYVAHMSNPTSKDNMLYAVIDGKESEGYAAYKFYQPPIFSDDGKHVAYAVHVESSTNGGVYLDGKRIGDYRGVAQIQFAPKTGKLAFFYSQPKSNNGCVVYVDGQTVKVMTRPKKLTCSPDGKHYAFLVVYNDGHSHKYLNYAVVDGKTWSTRAEGLTIAGPFFSPDSKAVVYYTQPGQEHNYVLNGAILPGNSVPPARYVVENNEFEYRPHYAFLEDGSFLYYTLEDGHLYRCTVSSDDLASLASASATTDEPAEQNKKNGQTKQQANADGGGKDKSQSKQDADADDPGNAVDEAMDKADDVKKKADDVKKKIKDLGDLFSF